MCLSSFDTIEWFCYYSHEHYISVYTICIKLLIEEKLHNNVNLAVYCVKYKNKLTRILRSYKIEFYNKKFVDVSYSPKLTWRALEIC